MNDRERYLRLVAQCRRAGGPIDPEHQASLIMRMLTHRDAPHVVRQVGGKMMMRYQPGDLRGARPARKNADDLTCADYVQFRNAHVAPVAV